MTEQQATLLKRMRDFNQEIWNKPPRGGHARGIIDDSTVASIIEAGWVGGPVVNEHHQEYRLINQAGLDALAQYEAG